MTHPGDPAVACVDWDPTHDTVAIVVMSREITVIRRTVP